jgi:phosphoribosylformylglycinamidine synthase
MYKAKVYVTLKEGILDPQGAIIGKALDSLGYKNVGNVRVGKFIQLELEGTDKSKLNKQVDEMSHRLLSNPVIESYTFELGEE